MKIPAIIIILLILASAVHAIGIIPGRTNINFEPGNSETVSVTVTNNENEKMDVMIQITGELSEYITTSENKLEFEADQSKMSFEYTITLPESFDSPGIKSADIKAVKKTIQGETDVSIMPNIEVISELFVNVPYEGKYLEARINAPTIKLGEDMMFFIKVFNLGEQDISEVYVSLDIFNEEDLIQTLKTESQSISRKRSGELIIGHPSDGFDPGEYRVVATVHYDGMSVVISGKIIIDEFMIRLESIGVGDFNLGGIAKISIYVTNIGNRLVEDFNTFMTLQDSKGLLAASIKSFDITLNPKDTKETVAYWNTQNIDPGEYLGTLSMSYDDKELVKNIRTQVTSDQIKIEVVNKATGFVISENPQPSGSNTGFLIIIIILLIVIMIMAFLKRKKSADQ